MPEFAFVSIQLQHLKELKRRLSRSENPRQDKTPETCDPRDTITWNGSGIEP